MLTSVLSRFGLTSFHFLGKFEKERPVSSYRLHQIQFITFILYNLRADLTKYCLYDLSARTKAVILISFNSIKVSWACIFLVLVVVSSVLKQPILLVFILQPTRLVFVLQPKLHHEKWNANTF